MPPTPLNAKSVQHTLKRYTQFLVELFTIHDNGLLCPIGSFPVAFLAGIHLAKNHPTIANAILTHTQRPEDTPLTNHLTQTLNQITKPQKIIHTLTFALSEANQPKTAAIHRIVVCGILTAQANDSLGLGHILNGYPTLPSHLRYAAEKLADLFLHQRRQENQLRTFLRFHYSENPKLGRFVNFALTAGAEVLPHPAMNTAEYQVFTLLALCKTLNAHKLPNAIVPDLAENYKIYDKYHAALLTNLRNPTPRKFRKLQAIHEQWMNDKLLPTRYTACTYQNQQIAFEHLATIAAFHLVENRAPGFKDFILKINSQAP